MTVSARSWAFKALGFVAIFAVSTKLPALFDAAPAVTALKASWFFYGWCTAGVMILATERYNRWRDAQADADQDTESPIDWSAHEPAADRDGVIDVDVEDIDPVGDFDLTGHLAADKEHVHG